MKGIERITAERKRQIEVDDGTNPDCWCNSVSGHMVGLPYPYVGKHWLSPSVAKEREALTEEADE